MPPEVVSALKLVPTLEEEALTAASLSAVERSRRAVVISLAVEMAAVVLLLSGAPARRVVARMAARRRG